MVNDNGRGGGDRDGSICLNYIQWGQRSWILQGSGGAGERRCTLLHGGEMMGQG